MSSATPPRIGRLMSVESHRAEGENPESSEMYDALRDLFLGSDEPVEAVPEVDRVQPPAHVDFTSPSIEALVLGHLPVQQSPWIMQYAKDAAAQRGGPVALLRIREGEATIDLVGSAATPAGTPAATIEEAIRGVAGIVKGVIVRVDPTSEPLLPEVPGIDAITLLTGADEAAIVGSYRTIKGLIGESPDHLPQLRLAIMGSSTDKAMAAAEKIQKAVEAHLRERIVVTACLAKIGSGRSTLIFRGLLADDVATVLGSLRGMLATARGAGAAPRPVPSEVISPTADEPVRQPVVSSRLGHASPAVQPLERQDEAADAKEAAAPSLSSHIAGLTGTAVSCPYQAGVEVAVDANGGVHLIARAESAADMWPASSSLLAASQWAKSHSKLIAMALGRPARKANASSEPTLHLMVAEAKGVSVLAETGIRPHLLVQVRVEGRTGWFCTDLA